MDQTPVTYRIPTRTGAKPPSAQIDLAGVRGW